MYLLIIFLVLLVLIQRQNRPKKTLIQDELVNYLKDKGYKWLAPLPLYSKFHHQKENDYLAYTCGIEKISLNDNNKIVALQKCSRKEDHAATDKTTLPVFTMLAIIETDKYLHFINMLSFLIDKCKANVRRLGIVSTDQIDRKYIDILKEWNIVNIHLRDYETTVNMVESGKDNGSGYWVSMDRKFKSKTIAMYYFSNSNVGSLDINDWNNKEKWVELGESYDNNRFIGTGYGLDRLMNLFFGVPYPNKAEQRRLLQGT